MYMYMDMYVCIYICIVYAYGVEPGPGGNALVVVDQHPAQALDVRLADAII